MADAALTPVAEPGTTVDAQNPWPGLEAFREADAAFFRGRERVSTDLSALVAEQRLVVLYGRSGLGKTSLLRAGVFPRLREARFLPVYVRVDFRSLGDPLRLSALRTQIKTAIEDAVRPQGSGTSYGAIEVPELDPEATLWEWFYRTDARFWNERSRRVYPVLVLDQFEEAFTHGRRTEAIAALTSAFLAEVVDLVRASVPPSVAARCERDTNLALAYSTEKDVCHVVLSLRKEYVPDLLRLKPQLPTILDHRFELRGMTHEEAEQVVTGPNPDLVEAGVEKLIVEFVSLARRSAADQSDEAMVYPAILSVFCRELNRRRRDIDRHRRESGDTGLDRINADLVTGQRDTIISEFYADNVRDLGDQVEAFIEDELITETGYRNSVAREQALLAPGVTSDVVERLTNRRIVRVEGSGPEARIELTHDVLAEPIMARRDRRRQRTREEAEREREDAERREIERQTRAAQAAVEAERLERERQRELEIARLQVVAAQREAEAAESLRRKNIQQRWLMAALAVAVVAAGVLAYRNQVARNQSQTNLATAYVEQALGLEAAGRRDQAAAYVAQALREDPGHRAAQGFAVRTVLDVNWPLPLARLDHEEPVIWAELDASSSTVLTVSGQVVRLWSVADGRELTPPMTHPATVVEARFVADGTRVLSRAVDGVVRLWEAPTRREIRSYAHPDARVSAVAVAAAAGPAEPEIVVTGATDGTVRVWTDGNAREVRVGDTAVESVQLSPGRALLLTVSGVAGDVDGERGRVARLWDWRRGRRLGEVSDVESVATAQFSPDGRLLAATFVRSPNVKVWTVPEGRLQLTVAHQQAVTTVAWSPDGTRIVTAGEDNVARVWDASNGYKFVDLAHDAPVTAASFGAVGARVVTTAGEVVRLWGATYGQSLAEPMRHAEPVRSAALSADGRYAVTTVGNSAWVWDVRAGAAVPSTLWLPQQPVIARPASNGRFVIAQSDGGWSAWDGVSGTPERLFDGERGIDWAETERGAGLLLQVEEGRVSVRREGSPAVTLAAAGVERASFVRGGQWVLTIAQNGDRGEARVWRSDTGNPVGPATDLSDSTAPVVPVVTLTDDGSLGVVRTSARSWLWRPESGWLSDALTSPDEYRSAWSGGTSARDLALAFVSSAHQIREVDTGRVVVPRLSLGAAWSWGFSPDGQTAVGIEPTDTRVLLAPVASTGLDVDLEVGRIPSAWAFSRDARRLAVGSVDGTVTVFDARTGRVLAPALGTGPPISFASFSADGRRVLAAADAVRLWSADIDASAETDALVSVLEILGGYQVTTARTLRPFNPRPMRLSRDQAAREATARGARVSAWALADRASRTINPFVPTTVDQFVKAQSASPDGMREVQERFPWHPGVRQRAN